MKMARHSTVRSLLAAGALSVCLHGIALAQFSSPESAAKVVALTGQVSVLKDMNPWALQAGSLVYVKQIIVTGADGYAKFEVSDGSTFEVFPNSRVTFRNNPSNWKDLLDVWLGRVKVHIEKLGGQPNHNRVTTPTAIISVRGTVFDVSVEDGESTLVSVEEGQVAVQHALMPLSDPKLLNPGEVIRVYKNQPLAEKSSDKSGVIQQGLRAATEALYRIVYRAPQAGGGGVPSGGTSGAGAGSPGDTDTKKPRRLLLRLREKLAVWIAASLS
jgi:Uncharacterized protein conserved in bacteria